MAKTISKIYHVLKSSDPLFLTKPGFNTELEKKNPPNNSEAARKVIVGPAGLKQTNKQLQQQKNTTTTTKTTKKHTKTDTQTQSSFY